jgi:hypothetical protein
MPLEMLGYLLDKPNAHCLPHTSNTTFQENINNKWLKNWLQENFM